MVIESTREQIAINAYLNLLKSKGVDETVLMIRTTILNELSCLLAGKTLDGAGYRQVVENYIEKVPATEWPLHLATAREYYHFWVEDFKAISKLNHNEFFAMRDDVWTPEPVTLKALSERLKTEKFEASEIWPLKAYQQALRNAGADQLVINTRSNLAKISLIRLRSATQKNQQSYRTVVDCTMPLFRVKNSRRIFLEVAREFYHFWTGNPEAENFVLKAA